MANLSNESKYQLTIKLIELVHDREIQNKFEKADGHPIALQKVWEDIHKELNVEKNFNAKVKYNSLFSKYKIEKRETNKSGSGRSSWRYYDLFDSTIPQSKKLCLEGVFELGELKDIQPEIKENPVKKKKINHKHISKQELINKRAKMCDQLINYIEKDTNKDQDDKIEKLNQKIEKVEKKIDEKFDEIINFLKKNNK